MRVQLAKWGNSNAVRLPKSIVDALSLTQGATFDVTVSGDEVRLRLVSKRPSYDLASLMAEARRLGPAEAPPFEDWSEVEVPWPDEPFEPDA